MAIDFACELAELAEKEAVELRKLTASLAYELKPIEAVERRIS